MAGGEVSTLAKALVDNGARHILWSFFYIKQFNQEHKLAQIMRDNPKISFFLDSGAFTYWKKYEADPERLWPYKDYVRMYFEYIGEFGNRYDRIAEPDLDNTFDEIDMDVVAEWREEMLERWPEFPTTPVWHWWRGPKAWTEWCKDPRIKHLAIGRQSGDIGYQRRLVMEAHRHGKTVHGFAQTGVKTELISLPYDTVDSSSVWAGQQYGTFYLFVDGKFIVLPSDYKWKRKLYRRHLQRIGIDYKLVEADDVAEVRRANVRAWVQLSSRLQAMRKIQKNKAGRIREYYGPKGKVGPEFE